MVDTLSFSSIIPLKRQVVFMSNGGKDFGVAVGAILLGILGGMILAAVLDRFGNYKCPVCHKQIQRGASNCPNCHVALRWD